MVNDLRSAKTVRRVFIKLSNNRKKNTWGTSGIFLINFYNIRCFMKLGPRLAEKYKKPSYRK